MTAIYSPLVEQDAVELSKQNGVWRKQILPRGTFNYKGEVIDFDKIGKDAKAAFDAGALDQVAFQLADNGNNHNFNPENYRGEVKSIELTEEGTFATFDFSQFPDMQDRVTKNPKFGVSARIERNYQRGDGKAFPHAFSHILGTLHPRVSGLKPWEKIDLSNVDDSDTIDLTVATEDKSVTKPNEGGNGSVTLSADEVEAFRKFMDDQKQIEDSLSGVQLSNDEGDEDSEAIKLANERADSALRLARESQIKLAASEWKSAKADLTREGVPPAILDLATPLMERPDSDVSAIELSNGDKLEPKAILLSVLEEMKGIIDLSAEKGHEVNNSEGDVDPEFDKFRDTFFADQF